MIVCLTVLTVIFAVWFMKVRIAGYSKKDAVLKTIAAVCLVALGAVCLSIRPTALGGWLFAGGLVGAIGDVSLGLSHISKERTRRHSLTKAGFLFFGCGHIIYIIGYLLWLLGGMGNLWYAIAPMLLGVCVGILFGTGGRRMGLHFGRYMAYVIFYVSVLVSCVGLAISLNVMTAFSSVQLRLFGIGIISFILSDIILSKTYFGKGAKSAGAVILNHSTYYLAQYLIAVSILYV